MIFRCFRCENAFPISEDANLYDIHCENCSSRTCYLCKTGAHFPASCSEKKRWERRGLPDDDAPIAAFWQGNCYQNSCNAATDILELEHMKTKFAEADPCLLYALDEMQRMLRTHKWIYVIMCANSHLKTHFLPHLLNLIIEICEIKKLVKLPTVVDQLNNRRMLGANAMVSMFTRLLTARSGGWYAPLSSTVLVRTSTGVVIGFPTAPVQDDRILPALAPEEVSVDDADVDWDAIVRSEMNLWTTLPLRM